MLVFLVCLKLGLLLVCVLLGVAFTTYFERKGLGYIQIRKGPNKWGIKGLLQPFLDAVKLFTNEVILLNVLNFFLYLMSPALSLFLMLLIWLSYPSGVGAGELILGVVFILCCLSVGVYPALIAGWSSNSKYSLIGSLRVVAQTISYEVSMVMILLSFIVLIESYNLDDILIVNNFELGLVNLPLMIIWWVSMLAELNRSPFDLSEGESELVSGFNTEYAGGFFALFFLAEYGMILFFCGFFSFFFLGGVSFFYLKFVFMVFAVIWIRGVTPRIRYDQLMMMAWKVFLPISIFYYLFWVGVSLFLV